MTILRNCWRLHINCHENENFLWTVVLESPFRILTRFSQWRSTKDSIMTLAEVEEQSLCNMPWVFVLKKDTLQGKMTCQSIIEKQILVQFNIIQLSYFIQRKNKHKSTWDKVFGKILRMLQQRLRRKILQSH